MVTDPIADFLTRIKNGYMARKEAIVSPLSKSRLEVARILKEAGYIDAYNVTKDDGRVKGEVEVTLRYQGKRPALENVIRVSKPGQRVYEEARRIPYVQTGHGMAIVSTSKGMMSDKEARKAKVGGEIICKVW